MLENRCPVIGEYPLSGSLVVSVRDETCHYFGGYYHVRLMVCCAVPVTEGMFASQEEYLDVMTVLGNTVCFERALEKMAVPEQKLDTVKQALLQSFETNLLPYLKHSCFAEQFVKKQWSRLGRKTPTYGK